LGSWIFNQNWPNSSCSDDQVQVLICHAYALSKKKSLPVSRLFWVSSLAYPNLFGTKDYVVVVVVMHRAKKELLINPP
jgi:hypothetical protein